MKTNLSEFAALEAKDILFLMIKEHLNLELPLNSDTLTKLEAENYVGICLPATFGAELMGVELAKFQQVSKTRIVFFLPFPEHIYCIGCEIADDFISIKKGCVITDNLTIQSFWLDEPIVANRLIFEGYKSPNEKPENNEVYALTQSKRLSNLFFEKYNIPTTDLQILLNNSNLSYLSESLNKISSRGKHKFVIKSIYDWGGYGVKLFDSLQDEAILQFVEDTLRKDGELIMERRIESYPLYVDGLQYDWNVRLLVSYDNMFEPIINLKLAHARIKIYDNKPIGYETADAPQVSLDYIFECLGISENSINLLKSDIISLSKKVGSHFISEIPQKGIHKYPTFLALDIILDINLRWRIIEINTGNVGDIPFNIELYRFDTNILRETLEGYLSENMPIVPHTFEQHSFDISMLRECYVDAFLYFANKI